MKGHQSNPFFIYRDIDSGECFTGAFLMNAGLYFPIVKADFKSFRRRFKEA